MVAKALIVFCLQIVLFKCTHARCVPGIPEVYAPAEFGMPSTFTSALAMQMPMIPAPSFAIMSDDLFVEGLVSVSGSLPFLGTVSLEGALPAAGQGTVLYRAGNGDVGIVREMPAGGVMAPMNPYLC